MNAVSDGPVAPTLASARVRAEVTALRDGVGTVIASAILVIGGPVVASFAITDFNARLAGLAAAMFVGLAIGLLLIRRGRGDLGRPIILLVIALELSSRAVYFGGVTSVPFTGWVVVVVLTSILIDPRASFVAAAIGIGAGLALYVAESTGTLPPPLRPETPLTALRISSALFVIMALLAWSMNRLIQRGIARFAGAEAQHQLLIERYELAGRGAHFGIWEWDRGRDRLWRDAGVQDLLGQARQAVEGPSSSLLAALHPEDRGTALHAFKAHVAGETPEYLADFRLRHADGR